METISDQPECQTIIVEKSPERIVETVYFRSRTIGKVSNDTCPVIDRFMIAPYVATEAAEEEEITEETVEEENK